MKPCRVGRVTLVAAFGLLLAVAATSSAQQVNKQGSQEGMPQHAKSGFGYGTVSQQLIDQLNEAVTRECAVVRTATFDDLRLEDEWLTALVNDAEAKARSSAKRHFEIAFRHRRGSPSEKPELKEDYERTWAEFEDDFFEVDAIEYFSESVGVCIEKQVRLLQGERRVRGTWTVICEDPGRILPDGTGHIDLELLTDNSIRGTVYQTGEPVRIEVYGRMRSSGIFSASTMEGQQPIVQVDGEFKSFDPLTASGSIWFGREVVGYAKLQCHGKWKSQ